VEGKHLDPRNPGLHRKPPAEKKKKKKKGKEVEGFTELKKQRKNNRQNGVKSWGQKRKVKKDWTPKNRENRGEKAYGRPHLENKQRGMKEDPKPHYAPRHPKKELQGAKNSGH